MSLSTRTHELRLATGGLRPMAAKLGRAVRTISTMLDDQERRRRIARLQKAGLVGAAPTGWQLILGAYHMMFSYILPSSEEFYEHYEVGHWWHQFLRVVEEPSTMLDPIGFGLTRETLIAHLVEVVHTSAGYDVALMYMWDEGLEPLRAELEQVVAGTHPRQDRIEALVENPAYPAALLEALDRYEADPVGQWRVDTLEAPEGCDELFQWGIETFGSPGRLFAYARTLPPTPGASMRAWWRGELPLPRPSLAG